MEKEELEKWREGGTRKSRVSLGVGPAAQLGLFAAVGTLSIVHSMCL